MTRLSPRGKSHGTEFQKSLPTVYFRSVKQSVLMAGGRQYGFSHICLTYNERYHCPLKIWRMGRPLEWCRPGSRVWQGRESGHASGNEAPFAGNARSSKLARRVGALKAE